MLHFLMRLPLLIALMFPFVPYPPYPPYYFPAGPGVRPAFVGPICGRPLSFVNCIGWRKIKNRFRVNAINVCFGCFCWAMHKLLFLFV